jgi:hypothetical protein
MGKVLELMVYLFLMHLKLKSVRLATAIEIGGLDSFLPIIEHCVSDDETDDEISPAVTTVKSQRQKYCKVRRVPWRSKDVEQALLILDTYRDKQLQGAPLGRKGNPPRLRRRPKERATSAIPPAKGLPNDCYEPDWLKKQSELTRSSLKIPKDRSDIMPSILEILSKKT